MNLIEPYSAAWYYQKWPKFYNSECYHILEDYSKHPEKYVTNDTSDEGVEECKGEHGSNSTVVVVQENKNLKRKMCECTCHGVEFNIDPCKES